jgi:hypothetical protein
MKYQYCNLNVAVMAVMDLKCSHEIKITLKCRCWMNAILGGHSPLGCSLLHASWWFLELLFNTEDGGNRFLQNISGLILNYMALYPRRWHCSWLPLQKPQNPSELYLHILCQDWQQCEFGCWEELWQDLYYNLVNL